MNFIAAGAYWQQLTDPHNLLARKALLSMAIHGAVILFLLCPVLWHSRRLPRDITPIDLTIGSGGGPGGGGPAAPQPKFRTAEHLIKPAPNEDAIPQALKTKPKVSTAAKPKPKPAFAKVNESEIRRALASSLSSAKLSTGAGPSTGTGTGTGGGGGKEVPFGWYYSLVHAAMYNAWQQPSSLSARMGLSSEVLLRVQRDGLITQRNLTRPSGNSLMDDSVMSAVNSVTNLPQLPPGLGDAYADIEVTFVLTESAP